MTRETGSLAHGGPKIRQRHGRKSTRRILQNTLQTKKPAQIRCDNPMIAIASNVQPIGSGETLLELSPLSVPHARSCNPLTDNDIGVF